MSNYKSVKVQPPSQGQYIKGTNYDSYFLIVSETAKGIIAFRALSNAVQPIGTLPTKGVQTRVRVVPAVDTPKIDKFMSRFGFGRVNGGSVPVHYSTVTSNPAGAIEDAGLVLAAA